MQHPKRTVSSISNAKMYYVARGRSVRKGGQLVFKWPHLALKRTIALKPIEYDKTGDRLLSSTIALGH